MSAATGSTGAPATLRRVGVIGGGILGLSVARQLTLNHPGIEVAVFEKENDVAAHQTGHNSGVVHAGLYYRPGSLKATLCRRGVGLLRDYCTEHQVAFRELGKVVVARSDAERQRLNAILERAQRNGVPNVALLDRRGLREVEPQVDGVAAVHSPHTAVVDYVAVCRALARDVEAAGGQVLVNHLVTGMSQADGEVQVTAGGSQHRFDAVVACAGLGSDAVAGLAGRAGDVRIIPFRGEYYRLGASARASVRGLVYPVPDPAYPFLGVHLTRGVDDEVLVGPNAVLALALEGYRWRDVKPADLAAMARWPGVRALARQHWRMGVREFATSVSKRRFTALARQYVPSLTADDLLPARSGVRAQAVDRRGGLVDDFVVDVAGRVVLVRNAPSPAATSSLAIAEHVAGLVAGAVR